LSPDLQKDLRSTIEQVKEFAYGDYAHALLKGTDLNPETRSKIISKISKFTGLTEEYVERTDLRINIYRFCKELLRDQNLTIGRLDSRFTGKDRDSAGEMFERDPSFSAILGPYAATLNHYVRSELDFELNLPYEILAPLYQKWSYQEAQNQYINVAESLRQAIATNPDLKVYVANGYYDFATPFFATEYTFNHIGLPEDYRNNITMSYFKAGHMMYIHLPSLAQMKQDLSDFIQKS
jgi:carboxypeptidase C (cathepsin A)